MSGKTSREFLAELRREIETHPGVNHLFLNRLATGMFSREDYRVFAENHYPLVCVFCSYLERLLVRAPDSESKLWLAKVLVDEYGEGSEGKDHSTLYAHFLDSSGGSAKSRVRVQRVATNQVLLRATICTHGWLIWPRINSLPRSVLIV